MAKKGFGDHGKAEEFPRRHLRYYVQSQLLQSLPNRKERRRQLQKLPANGLIQRRQAQVIALWQPEEVKEMPAVKESHPCKVSNTSSVQSFVYFMPLRYVQEEIIIRWME